MHEDEVARTPLGRATLKRIAARPDLVHRRFGSDVVLEVPDGPSRDDRPRGRRVAPTGWRASGTGPNVEHAIDGDIGTHWLAPRRVDPAVLRIDLGRVHLLTDVMLRFGPHVREFPDHWVVRTSLDGRRWQQVGGERVAVPPFASYRRRHRDVEARLPIRPAWARFIEIRMPSTILTHRRPRGVHEVELYERAGSPSTRRDG